MCSLKVFCTLRAHRCYKILKMALITPYWGLDGIIIFLSLLMAAYLYMTRHFKYWKKRGIMEIPPSPFIGNFADCFLQRKTIGEFIKGFYDSCKGLPYMGFYIFDKPVLFVRDPELIKRVLIKDFNHFADRYATPDPDDRLGYANLLMIKNPAWRILRTKLTPIYTSGKLKKMYTLMLDVSNDLNTYLDSLQLDGPGKEVEIKELLSKFTTDLIGTTAFGLQVNSLNNPDAEFRQSGRAVFECSFRRSLDFVTIFLAPDLVKPLRSKFFGIKASNFLRRAFWEALNQREASGVKRGDLIDILIELKNTHEGDLGGFKFDGDDLVAQAAIFFTGGFETASTTCTFTLYELALHLDIQDRVRREIENAIKESNGNITYDLITNLPYLDMVIAETLRMYPPLAFLDRCATMDYKVPNSDLEIKKGTPVLMSLSGLHYDPDYFPNPTKFDPERFNEENKRDRPSCVYLPFGDGPHVCIGMRLGLIQVKLGLVNILRQYEVTPNLRTLIPMKIDPKSILTTAHGGLYLNMRKISTEAG
ncbi:hypothetical protein KM043_012492 [Ampulex compressa]|nr:hypothetical protein KM043_012492 [Ampulex compressa]